MTWVLLYSQEQDAYHIETAEEYRSRLTNGYRVLTQGTWVYCDKYLAFLYTARKAVDDLGIRVEVGGRAL